MLIQILQWEIEYYYCDWQTKLMAILHLFHPYMQINVSSFCFQVKVTINGLHSHSKDMNVCMHNVPYGIKRIR